MQILLDTAALVAINKPPGLNVHEAPGAGSSVLRELREKQGLDNLTPVHRLDKDASGVLLLAKDKNTAGALQRVWDQVEKTYIALCEGTPPQDCGVIEAPLLENQTGKPERLRNAVRYYQEKNPGIEIPPLPRPKTSGVHPAGRASQTEYRVLEKFTRATRGFSLLEVKPKQGRMHQIRVHLAHAGCPIVGDKLYAAAAEDRARTLDSLQRMALHAARLVFPDPGNLAKEIAVDAALAEDIAAALKELKK